MNDTCGFEYQSSASQHPHMTLSRWLMPLLILLLRHWDFWPSLPGQGQEEQGLLCPEADEDP